MTEQELREQVALGCRILAATGHDDFVWGHVSARDPQGRGVWMKASTFGFEEITAEHVILVGFDGASPTTRRPCASAPPSGPNDSRPRCGITSRAAGRVNSTMRVWPDGSK